MGNKTSTKITSAPPLSVKSESVISVKVDHIKDDDVKSESVKDTTTQPTVSSKDLSENITDEKSTESPDDLLSNLQCPSGWNVKPYFTSSQGWSWGETHQMMLFTIAEDIGCPTEICAMIQSFVWTSAITICKNYTDQLVPAFNVGNRSTKYGINPLNPLNVLILGAKKVGKTNLVSRFYANAFIKVNSLEGLSTETTRCRIDVDLKGNGGKEETQRLYLRLYDTVGFNTISGYYKTNIVKEAHCIMLVFDVSNENTYQWHAAWNLLGQIKKIRFPPDIEGDFFSPIEQGDIRQLPVVMVGSKIDEIDNNIDDEKRKAKTKMADFTHVTKRVVAVDKIRKQYCIPYHAPYIEVSSKCCTNVEQLFQIVAKEAMLYVANKSTFD